jgi:hypothetical protein
LREVMPLFPPDQGKGCRVALDELEAWVRDENRIDVAEAYGDYCLRDREEARRLGLHSAVAAAEAIHSGTYVTRDNGEDNNAGDALGNAAKALALFETPGEREPGEAAIARAHARLRERVREIVFPFTPLSQAPKKYSGVWEALVRDTASRHGLSIEERLFAETVLAENLGGKRPLLPIAERLVLAPRHRSSLDRR